MDEFTDNRIIHELKVDNDRLRTELFRQDERMNEISTRLHVEIESLRKQLQAERSRCDTLRYQIYRAAPWDDNLGEVSDEEFIIKVKEQLDYKQGKT